MVFCCGSSRRLTQLPYLKHILQKGKESVGRSVMPDFLRPRGLQHARLPCPSLSPRACSNSCPLSFSSTYRKYECRQNRKISNIIGGKNITDIQIQKEKNIHMTRYFSKMKKLKLKQIQEITYADNNSNNFRTC